MGTPPPPEAHPSWLRHVSFKQLVWAAICSLAIAVVSLNAPFVHKYVWSKYATIMCSREMPIHTNSAVLISILVGHLDNDDEGQTLQIVDWLSRVLGKAITGGDIQVSSTCSTIVLAPSSDVFVAKREAENSGRKLLKESGADLLIWGKVVAEKVHQIDFLPLKRLKDQINPDRYQLDDLRQPPKKFKDDLALEIASLITAAVVPDIESRKLYTHDPCKSFSVKDKRGVVHVYPDCEYSGGWNTTGFTDYAAPSATAKKAGTIAPDYIDYGTASYSPDTYSYSYSYPDQGSSYSTGGDFSTPTYQQLYEKVARISELDLMSTGLAMCRMQFVLGYIALNTNEHGTDYPTRAIEHFKKVTSKNECGAEEHLKSQSFQYLGDALMELSDQGNSTDQFEGALVAYGEALNRKSRKDNAADWAITEYNIGIVLHSLGEHEKGTIRLQKAADAYSSSLEVFTNVKQDGLAKLARTALLAVQDLIKKRAPGGSDIVDGYSTFSKPKLKPQIQRSPLSPMSILPDATK